MSHEERNTVSALLTSLCVLAYFGWRIGSTWTAGGYATPDGLQLWARTVIWMIPVSIVLTIVITIGFNILHAIATNTPNPSFVTDERDAQIGRRAMRVTTVVASTGFIFAVITLALGWQALAGLNIILAGFALGDITGNLSKICAYRLGV